MKPRGFALSGIPMWGGIQSRNKIQLTTMTPLGIILGIVFIYFLGQAILETFWGLCLVLFGLLIEGLALVLDGVSFLINSFEKIKELENSINAKTPSSR